ncbi:MAG TPA: hypothetical protein VHD61_15040 [Lacunisphaera sp.]|nr:hypothetical protein [Lacunisphaera sp.]
MTLAETKRTDWAHKPHDARKPAKIVPRAARAMTPGRAWEFCRKFTDFLESAVAFPACAIRYTVFALLAVVAAYLGVHLLVWSYSHKHQAGAWENVLRPIGATGAAESGISDDGNFSFHFRDDILNRYFARDKINAWKQDQEEKGRRLSDEVLGRRKGLLRAAAHFVYTTFDLAMARTFFPNDPEGDTVSDANYRNAVLPEAAGWLNNELNGRSPSLIPPEKRVLAESFRQALMREEARERSLRETLAAQIAGLKPVLSFDWMLVSDAWWIVEVIFWCIFGILAKTMIRLIEVGRLPSGAPGGYDPTEFLLFIPKSVLAPLLAVVVVSWWATGYSEAQINFANLPYLLVFFFSLGFMTETVYKKLSDLGSLLVSQAATASAAKMGEAARQDVYKFRNPAADPANAGPVNTVAQLAAATKAVAASALERGVVTREAQPKTT